MEQSEAKQPKIKQPDWVHPYCRGFAACKDICQGEKAFDGLEEHTVVFENGQYFRFEDFTKDGDLEREGFYGFLQELPRIEDKDLLKNIFCDDYNTIGINYVYKNDDGLLFWKY